MTKEELQKSIEITQQRANAHSIQLVSDHCLGDVLTAAENWLRVMKMPRNSRLEYKKRLYGSSWKFVHEIWEDDDEDGYLLETKSTNFYGSPEAALKAAGINDEESINEDR